jgi:cellulose biosynthesis protein BcsQ
MGKVIAVFCDKGGVGKTTISLMLAHGFSAAFDKSLLVIDIDETPRLSEAIMGAERFKDDVATDQRVSSLLRQLMFHQAVDTSYFIREFAGGVKTRKGSLAQLAVIPGDRKLQHEQDLAIGHLLTGNHASATRDAQNIASESVEEVVRRIRNDFDYVLIDLPPRVTHFSKGALRAADVVIVPYIPGAGADVILSETGQAIEGVESGDELDNIPHRERAYLALPNKVVGSAKYAHKASIEELLGQHPHVDYQVPEKPDLAKLIKTPDVSEPLTMKEKFGSTQSVVRKLCESVDRALHQRLNQGVAA